MFIDDEKLKYHYNDKKKIFSTSFIFTHVVMVLFD